MTAPDVTTAVERVSWRCFHCDEVFTDRRCAAAHFGANEDAEPACQIAMGGERTLLEALRRAEKDAGDAWAAIHAESTEAAKAYYAQQGRHAEQLTAAEQVGYERGLRDAKAHPDTLGLAPLSELDRLSAALGEAREALKGFIDWGQQQCPCRDETPDPCPLCDATVAAGRCKAVEAKFPPRILARARTALQQQEQ